MGRSLRVGEQRDCEKNSLDLDFNMSPLPVRNYFFWTRDNCISVNNLAAEGYLCHKANRNIIRAGRLRDSSSCSRFPYSGVRLFDKKLNLPPTRLRFGQTEDAELLRGSKE